MDTNLTAQTTANCMSQEFFVKMRHLPLRFFDTRTYSDLMSRLINDLDNVQIAL